MSGRSVALTFAVALLIQPPRLLAAPIGPQKSGNEIALEYVQGGKRQRQALERDLPGSLFLFRYLRITSIERGETNGVRHIAMAAVEPSSEMAVRFVVTKAVSLERADPLKEGEAVAVRGRIESIGETTNTIVLNPVIVEYKDRLSPKQGVELLFEVDPEARKGTDTSSGEEQVIKAK
jgi:hypothetical protein